MEKSLKILDQHYNYFKNLFNETDIKISYLKNSMPAKIKNQTLKSLKSGSIDIIIGTHSLLNTSVSFKQLGLCIID